MRRCWTLRTTRCWGPHQQRSQEVSQQVRSFAPLPLSYPSRSHAYPVRRGTGRGLVENVAVKPSCFSGLEQRVHQQQQFGSAVVVHRSDWLSQRAGGTGGGRPWDASRGHATQRSQPGGAPLPRRRPQGPPPACPAAWVPVSC